MMLVMARVALALCGTDATCLHARHHLCAAEVEIQLGLASYDLRRHGANAAAVEAEPDTLHHIHNTRLGKARVGTQCTDLGTLRARLDAIDERRLVDCASLLLGMDVQHLPNQAFHTLRRCHPRHSKKKDNERSLQHSGRRPDHWDREFVSPTCEAIDVTER
jgi:hypothetical protein